MVAELRWPGDPHPDSGIDVRSLELDSGELVMLDILRRPEVMAYLAQWNAGAALGDDTYDRVRASSALAVVTVHGQRLTDYARGGSARRGGVDHRPAARARRSTGFTGVSLRPRRRRTSRTVAVTCAARYSGLQYTFRELAGTEADESQVIVLRFCEAPRQSVPAVARASSPHADASRNKCQAAWIWSSPPSRPN